MANSKKSGTCTIVCWVVAIIVGLIVVKLTAAALPFVLPLFLGLIVGLITGLLLTKMLCKADPVAAVETAHQSLNVRQAEAAEELEEAEDAAEDAVDAAEEAVEAAEAAAEQAAREAQAAMQAEEIQAAAAADPAPAVEVKSSQLAGQEELAARKGEWKYQAPAEDAAPVAAEPAAAEPVAADDSVQATQPTGLSAAREGGADDLKQIKGVGPKLEQLLNSLGLFHFDQIADWAAADVAWMDDNLKGFKGRVTRDGWVDQAKVLASGEETEFSKRVEDGSVY